MEIVYHLGAHCTDEERLLKCLLRNRELLTRQGIAVPGPARYRNLLRDTAIQLKGQTASAETQAMVLEQILQSDTPRRMVLSWENFLSFPQWVLKGTLYHAAAERVRAFQQIFPDHRAEFHIGIRNLAGFLPALFARQKDRSYDEFLGALDTGELYWSDVIDRVREENPDVPLTVWCDEDTPLIWPDVLQAVSGHDPDTALEGADDLLAMLLSRDGLARMRAYLASRPPGSAIQRRQIAAAFLDKYVLPGANRAPADLPGWTQDSVDALTEAYYQDVARIAARSDITFLAP
ncbi:MAG: hypothetical protein QM656_11770 [Paracoccaceae bacterium]